MSSKGNAYYFIIGFLCLQINYSTGQDQRVADSLIHIYQEGKLKGKEKLILLNKLSFNELNDIELSLKYSEELIVLSKLAQNDEYLYRGYYQCGNNYFKLGELEKALTAFVKSSELANGIGLIYQGSAYMSIAQVYAQMDNLNNAEIYYSKAINKIREENKDSVLLGSVLLNAGDNYFNNKKYDQALEYFEESGQIFNNIDYSIGTAYNLGNLGMVYAEQGKDALAEQNIDQAIAILEEIKDYYPIAVYLTYMSDIYLRKNDWTNAFNYTKKSLNLAQKQGLKQQISDASLQLSELHELAGNYKDANTNLKIYYSYRDSVLNIASVKNLADLRTNHEVSQKQAEIDLKDAEVDLLNEKQRNQRITIIATVLGLGLILFLALGLFRRNRFIQKTSDLIQEEKDRSDKLLLNILPEETAQELKDNDKVQAKRFESVSVMFTDFKDFTNYSDKLSPEELVESVDYYYSKFDEIIQKYGLEKIKTVGDSYMAAGGLPLASTDHALKMIQAAFEIVDFVNESKKVNPKSMARFDIRVGINSGPVVAGVVGTIKFAYDIWGDSVNIASRMESNSEPGRINISENTYTLIKEDYDCSYRGEIQAKNKGALRMYFVNQPL